MTMMRTNGMFPVVAAAVGVMFAGSAFADVAAAKATVDAAKAAGVVGEQADGYLVFVKPGDGATQSAVAEINAGRAEVYRQAAARNNVTPAAAGASAFQAVVMGKLKPGEFYKPAGGGWVRK
jgi:uncharacterized protein YdbL (DUF1318 family)